MIYEQNGDAINIACIGECMVEISSKFHGSNQANLGFAGDTMNTAVYLSRILASKRFNVSYVTRLGSDKFSERALGFLGNEGLDTKLIGQDKNHNIGIHAIDLDQDGERSFTYWRSQSAAKGMFSGGTPSFQDITGFNLIFISAITLAILPPLIRNRLIKFCGRAKSDGCLIAFDSNYRPSLWKNINEARRSIDRMWANCSIAMPSFDDEQRLNPGITALEVIDRIAEFGADEVVLKSGIEGPQTWPDRSLCKFLKSNDVVDTTGAGDSFNAGYLAARLTGESQSGAAQAGHTLALKVIAGSGAIIPKKEMGRC